MIDWDGELAGRAHRDGHDTEHDAAASIAAPAALLRRQVLLMFARAGGEGRTDYENARELHHPFRHSIATRREELIRAGWPISDSGERRQTDTGRSAIVWRLAPEACERGLREAS